MPTWLVFGTFAVLIVAILCCARGRAVGGRSLAAITVLCFALLVVFLLAFGRRRRGEEERYTEVDGAVGNELMLPELADKLKVYISTMGHNSFADGDYTWKDISGHKDVRDEDGVLLNRGFRLSELPTYGSLKDGVSTKGLHLLGPESVDLGIRGNDNFTVFWFSQNLSRIPAGATVPVFTMYANTYSNVGVEVAMAQDDANTCIVVVSESLGRGGGDGDAKQQEAQGAGGADKQVHRVALTTTGFMGAQHLYAVTRHADKMRVYMDGVEQGSFTVGNDDILYSNKRCEVNSSEAWDATLVSLGLYRRALSGAELLALLQYTRGRQVQLSDEYQKVLSRQRIAQQKQQCAISNQVYCDTYCKNIKDWTNITDVMINASEECKQRISDYCVLHTDEEFCKCWSLDNKNNANCRFVRGFFGNDMSASNLCTTAKYLAASREPTLHKYYTNADGTFSAVGPGDAAYKNYLGPAAGAASSHTTTAAVGAGADEVKPTIDASGVRDVFGTNAQTAILKQVYDANVGDAATLLPFLKS